MYETYVAIATFLFNATPVIVTIVAALFVLNIVRLALRSNRKKRWMKKQAAAKKPVAFNTFETI